MSTHIDDLKQIKQLLHDINDLLNNSGTAAKTWSSNIKNATGSGGTGQANGQPVGTGAISTPIAPSPFNNPGGTGGGPPPPNGSPVGGLPPPMGLPPSPVQGGGGGGLGLGSITPASAALRGITAVGGGILGMMPDTANGVDMQQALFQASMATGRHMGAGDFDRLSRMTQSNFGNMQTSIGSAQRSAAIVSQFGFNPYGAAGQKMLGQVGAISLTTGMSNEQVSGTLATQSTNSVMTNRMRMIGFETFDSAGNPKDVASIAKHIVKVVYGNSPKPEQIQMGLRPGGALDLMLQSYIPDPGMQQLVKDNMFKQALNNGQYTANDATTAGKLGLTNDRLNPRGAGMNYASSESRKSNAFRNSSVNGFSAGLDAASSLNDAFTELATNVGIISDLLQGLATVSGFGSGFLGTGPGQAIAGMLSMVPGGSAITSLLKMVGHAGGGTIRGPGGPKGDKIPALLSDGEFVVQADAVQKYGVDLFKSLNAKRFADGGLTISGHPALQDGDPHLKTFSVAGGRSITVADWAGPIFQDFLKQWQEDPLLGNNGAGPLTLTKGPLDSWEYRPGRMTKDKISDHAGYAVDIRYDVLQAPDESTGIGKHYMSSEQQAEAHKILAGFSGKLGWGGDYGKAVDEMHVFIAPGINGPNDTGSASSASTSNTTVASANTSSTPIITGIAPQFTGVNVGSGLSGTSGKAQSILSAIGVDPGYASLGVNQGTSSQSVGAANSTATPGVASGNYGSGTLSGANLVKLLHDTGFSGGDLRTAYGVVLGESGGNPNITHKNTSGEWAGSTDFGLFQMNDVTNKTAGGETVDYTPAKIFDPAYNAHIGFLTKSDPKYNGWNDWNAYSGTSSEYSKGLADYDAHPDWHQGFSKGAWRIDKDQIANIHQNEMILPAPAAEAVRTVMRESRAGQTSSPSKIGNNVVINLSVAKATDDDARRVARKVKQMLDEDSMLDRIGGGHL